MSLQAVPALIDGMHPAILRFWSQPAPTYRVMRWLFPRLLALCYLIAFWSWDVQCDGLVGDHGIQPAAQLMENVHAYEQRAKVNLFADYPSLFYWRCDDAFLHLICTAGSVVAVLVVLGLFQGPLLAFLWFAYLSIVVTGGVFMSFQWDALLLEAGLLTLFVVPWRWWSGRRINVQAPDAPTGAVFLLHWLLFRLMFLSGYVKWGGGDKTWADFTALAYHFETQPLPNPLAWWAHNLPRSVHVFDCGMMYVIELVLPFCLWLGRWGRLAACVGFCCLMAGVALTGNYNFFNLLTIFLALTLLDDGWWPKSVKRWLECPDIGRSHRWRWQHLGAYAVAVVLFIASLVAADEFCAGRIPGHNPITPGPLADGFAKYVAPWRSVNAYGLFQQMTTERMELNVQVTDDMLLWHDVPFKWKPGDEFKAPCIVAPYQPRLDWQMWFAALYPSFVPQRDQDPRSGLSWFGPFLSALLEGRKEVWALVGEPPVPTDQIRAIRVQQRRYHFTTPAERAAGGAWWKWELTGRFSPELMKPTR